MPSEEMNLRRGLRHVLDHLHPTRIIFAAIVVRLLFGLIWMLTVNMPPENVPVSGDTWFQAGADGYLQIARTLIESGEYAFMPGGPPVHNRPPVQVLLLLVFGAWWPEYWYLIWMVGSTLLSLLMLSGLHRLTREFSLSPRLRNAVLLFAGFHPYLIFISKTTTFINAATLLLVLVTLFVLRIRHRPLVAAPFAGLFMGIGALTHGTFLLMPLLAAPYILTRQRILAIRRVAATGLLIICAAAVVAPWTMRNIRTFDRAIPVVTGNGYHYWKGDAVYFGGHYPMARLYEAETGKPFEEMYYGAVDPDADDVLWRLAKEDMTVRPERIPLRLLIGTGAFFAPWDGGPKKAVVSAVLNVPLLLLLSYGFLRALRRRQITTEQIALTVLLIYIVEAFAFFVSWGSYFTMLLPLAILLAASLFENTKTPGPEDTKEV
ncbi:MAG: DUF2029 domain-containing protein [Bacteroidetes bacterium]|nr:DUF2029 domain-containing protein [Bacteroidota bacterium]